MRHLNSATGFPAAITLVFSLAALTGCGGGGGGNNPPPTSGWTAGMFPPRANFEAKCATPRSGIDPTTGQPYLDRQGTATDENNWLRSWTNDFYLWYREVPDQNPANFATAAYFGVLKTSATTASGQPKDKFHFTYATSDWIALSQSGSQLGYGAQWVILSGTPPRQLVIAYTDPGSPAAVAPANLARGAQVLFIDGVDLVDDNTQAGVDTLNAGIAPATVGEVHQFVVQDAGAAGTRNVSLTSANVVSVPVQNVGTIDTGSAGLVGYILFNDHIATAESQLIDAVTTLKNAGISDLVLDIRYNGGGYLDIASEMAYMIAGPAHTAGQTFEELQFNDKYPTTNPIAGGPLTPTTFHATAQGFSAPAGQALPTLNLPRVYVLSGTGTCSASESIINSLRGVGVDVIEVGSTTCGKPYGFYPDDNCGTTYFSIEFRGVNAAGFGDYSDGFSPQNSAGTVGALIPGCSVADDFSKPLGDPTEGRLASALFYRANANCPTGPTGAAGPAKPVGSLAASDGTLIRPPWRENRILRR
ncbi:MAG TPA: S41 family peptidase [Steroidobacteraceae bacterium]|nr:S41 family peptidase [Steroidobacteraceae bacterium]